jgi:DNA polymerase-3 subunit delta
LGELADLIRHTAGNQAFQVREIFFAEKNFDWQLFNSSADNLSIFSEKKVIDLRLNSSTPGSEGSKAIISYCQKTPEDTLLLITASKLSKEVKSAWFQAIDKIGVIVQVWPLTGKEFLRWLENKMQQRGLVGDPEMVRILANRLEGNLLAANQEIEKLFGLYGPGNLNQQQISDAVVDSSRYDVFKLVESALAGQVDRTVKILSSLKSEGIAATLVLWSLAREARLLVVYKAAQGPGAKDHMLKNNGVWGERKQLIEHSARRISHGELNHVLVLGAKADRQIKGQQPGDAWETLLQAALALASVRVLERAG